MFCHVQNMIECSVIHPEQRKEVFLGHFTLKYVSHCNLDHFQDSYSHLKSNVRNILVKTTGLHINLNIDDNPTYQP
jgi:hypothetical protein